MKTFSINYNNNEVKVAQHDETEFIVHCAGKDLHLHLKQDNEGANHWFEAGTENATEESKKAGAAIEEALNKQKN